MVACEKVNKQVQAVSKALLPTAETSTAVSPSLAPTITPKPSAPETKTPSSTVAPTETATPKIESVQAKLKETTSRGVTILELKPIEWSEEEKKDYLIFLGELQEKVNKKRAAWAEKDPDYLRRTNHELNQNRINFLFLGLDRRTKEERGPGAWRADAPMIISLNTKTGQVDLIRFPRDLHAPEVDDLSSKYKGYPFRINAVTAFGSLDDARRVFENATGLSQDFCFSLDFEAFRDTVDILGGVAVDVDPDFVKCYAWEIEEWLNGEIKAGWQYLNGKRAFNYIHWRERDSDTARGQRQMQMVKAIARTAILRIKEEPLLTTVKLTQLILRLKKEKGIDFVSEFSLFDFVGFIDDLKRVNLGLTTDNFVAHSPWDGLIYTPWSNTPEGDTLEYEERYQQFFRGFSTKDPDDPLDYWQPLRDYIVQNFK